MAALGEGAKNGEHPSVDCSNPRRRRMGAGGGAMQPQRVVHAEVVCRRPQPRGAHHGGDGAHHVHPCGGRDLPAAAVHPDERGRRDCVQHSGRLPRASPGMRTRARVPPHRRCRQRCTSRDLWSWRTSTKMTASSTCPRTLRRTRTLAVTTKKKPRCPPTPPASHAHVPPASHPRFR